MEQFPPFAPLPPDEHPEWRASEPELTPTLDEALAPIRQMLANLASRLHHVETHWAPTAHPTTTADVLAEFDRLSAHLPQRVSPSRDALIAVQNAAYKTYADDKTPREWDEYLADEILAFLSSQPPLEQVRREALAMTLARSERGLAWKKLDRPARESWLHAADKFLALYDEMARAAEAGGPSAS